MTQSELVARITSALTGTPGGMAIHELAKVLCMVREKVEDVLSLHPELFVKDTAKRWYLVERDA